MPKYLPNAEMLVYMSTYVFFVAYGGWHLFEFGANVILRQHYYAPADFRAGWTWLFGRQQQRPQEIDAEWQQWSAYLVRNLPWILGHALVVELTWTVNALAKYRSHINAAMGVLFIAQGYGIAVAIGLVLYIGVCHRMALAQRRLGGRRRQKWLVWTMAGILMGVLTVIKCSVLPRLEEANENNNDDVADYEWLWDVCVIGAWTICRMLSACLDTIDAVADADAAAATAGDDDDNKTTVKAAQIPHTLDVIAYTLYIPTVFFGPILIFSRYQAMQQQREHPNFPSLRDRLSTFGATVLIRLAAAYALLELLAHAFYVNALHANLQLVESMPLPALYAYGYAMGMRFYLKYVFVYGWSLALCRLQGMPAVPAGPRCIGRVHQYSDMWKWFDAGLYEFLFRYIYAALCAPDALPLRKLAASSATFAFVFVFHGTHDYVLVWSALNYACIVLEMVARWACKEEAKRQRLRWSVRWQRRAVAVMGAQLLLLAILANFFFFGGLRVGWIFLWRTYGAMEWTEYAVLSGCMMCVYHTGEWVKRNEMEQQQQPPHRRNIE